MADWRKTILKEFKKEIYRLTLVSDPDGLLTEEQMLTEIKQRGFDLIPFEDSVAFRYAYESKYRSIWDRGEKTELVVVLRNEDDLQQLPYDLLKAGRKLEFSLDKLFPNLNYPVLKALDRSLLDPLFDAYEQDHESTLGRKATSDFVLRWCFGIERSMIGTAADLAVALLKLHRSGRILPMVLSEHLVENLKVKYVGWELDDFLSNQSLFLQFVQKQWQHLIESFDGASEATLQVHESHASFGWSDSADLLLIPFDHPEVQAYVDTLFLEGLLNPINCKSKAAVPQWAHVGVKHDPVADSLKRYAKLVEQTETGIPKGSASHSDWQKFARAWAEAVVLRWEIDEHIESTARNRWHNLHVQVECRFADWMKERFGSLYNLPSLPNPVMVHHVPHYLVSVRNNESLRKLALVVMDGLALDQWLILRRLIQEQRATWRLEETNVFAWVPSLTSISRQSIFAAQPPMYFAKSMHDTSPEPRHWKRFWEDQGVAADLVHYAKKVTSGETESLDKCLANSNESIVGIVVNTVDEIMHGEKQGAAGMHDAVRLEAKRVISLLDRLIGEGYEVFMTADHGNIAAKGVGKPDDGVLPEVTGKRARLYESDSLRAQAKADIPASLEWSGVGLPSDRFALLPEGLSAFTFKDKNVVSHGGIALEEIIVPFVRFCKEEE
ncbi:PglZ domain protein [Symmachiella dynata]|uniref:PglZ domain protein n=1 Tax=Symmachiella dynata TaxID=2527995 RepID=A0A517ZY25_9PLAN|nr:BREX-3 system phosphatase PglZ [Symmachiella dynata]QDU47374.1 PglZ domain protein [Symmachiella dynata]